METDKRIADIKDKLLKVCRDSEIEIAPAGLESFYNNPVDYLIDFFRDENPSLYEFRVMSEFKKTGIDTRKIYKLHSELKELIINNK